MSIAGVLLVAYISLIAIVMSYASLTVESTQSVKNDESIVATLEAAYLAAVADITISDYHREGYAPPTITTFVRGKSVTALR